MADKQMEQAKQAADAALEAMRASTFGSKDAAVIVRAYITAMENKNAELEAENAERADRLAQWQGTPARQTARELVETYPDSDLLIGVLGGFIEASQDFMQLSQARITDLEAELADWESEVSGEDDRERMRDESHD